MSESAELEFGFSRGEDGCYSLRYRFWRAGSAVESTLGPPAPIKIKIDFDQLRALLPDPERYGQALSAAVFADSSSASAFALAQAIAVERSQTLRLRLYIDPAAAELHSLRWETLTAPNLAHADNERPLQICKDEKLLFSRFLASASTQPFAPPERARLRALVVIANPINLSRFSLQPVDITAELQRARAGLDGMEIVELAGQGQATLENLRDQLRQGGEGAPGFDILYLAAHGGRDRDKKHYVLLENPDGTAHPVYADELTSSLGWLPLLALLVSCLSAGDSLDPEENSLLALGPLLAVRGVPAVVAMQGNIGVETMTQFLPVLFRELKVDGQIDRALAAARWKVRDKPDWWMPVLFSRLRDNRLLLPPRAALPLAIQYFEPETVFIPAGKFILGRDPGPDIPTVETPRHEVDLSSFRIGKYPVTNGQFAEFVAETREIFGKEAGWFGFKPPPNRLNYPVYGVTWEQAVRYCEWLSKKTGRRYMLPTEAQWEKAARGTTGGLYPWGDHWDPRCCNADPKLTTPVDQYPPHGPYGCCDMVGNIREWTLTRWGTSGSEPDYPYPWKDDDRNNPASAGSTMRVIRGGAAADPAKMVVTARRGHDPRQPGLINRRLGFRVVLLND
jgi:formylglycine-generating enzyme required for sulfatase activity